MKVRCGSNLAARPRSHERPESAQPRRWRRSRRRPAIHPVKPFAARRVHRPPSTPSQRLKPTLLGHSASRSEQLFLPASGPSCRRTSEGPILASQRPGIGGMSARCYTRQSRRLIRASGSTESIRKHLRSHDRNLHRRAVSRAPVVQNNVLYQTCPRFIHCGSEREKDRKYISI